MTLLSIPNAEPIFDELIDRALAGEEIFIDCGDGRLVKLEPVTDNKAQY
jgi:hypothetical protein